MKPNRFPLIASLVCTLLIASCAPLLHSSKVAPPPPSPQIEMPAEARQPCEIKLLGKKATQQEQDDAYVIRGAQIMKCDAARALAVSVHDAEHALEAKLQKEREERAKPWWRLW